MTRLGFECNPAPGAPRTDIIQAVRLGQRERVVAFCRAVQRCSPVGAHILPVPGVTPGYGDEVIFADGTFVDGSTLELSADGPLRPPFAVYMQGRVISHAPTTYQYLLSPTMAFHHLQPTSTMAYHDVP